jgi:hypothetical protein
MNDVAIPSTVTLPRGAWYLLEGVCQNPTPWTTTVLTTRAARLWSKIHKANPAKNDDGLRFDRPMLRTEGESEFSYQTRAVSFNDAFDSWQQSGLELSISAKERSTLEKGVTWALKNRDKVWPQNNDHILAILTEFDADDGDDENAPE